MQPAITSDIVVAYAQCPRKAYLLLFSPEHGTPHEYVRTLLANPPYLWDALWEWDMA